MIDLLLRWFARSALWLRYRVRVVGLEKIAAGRTRGILFLPNHPALIDPILLGTVLHKRFRARFLADAEQVDRFFIRWVARRVGAIEIPDPGKVGAAAREAVQAGLARCVEALRNGDNVVIYPAGQILRGRRTDLRGNVAAARILRELDDVRVVLVRTTGLWGSLFSYAFGRVPRVGEVLGKAVRSLLAGGIVFSPRRRVTVEFHEPDDLPRGGDRETLNRYLEAFYNADAPPAVHVPYTPWERGGRREMPEPDFRAGSGDLGSVGDSTRRIVFDYLREQAGVGEVSDGDHLARDLALDSLARAEVLAWLAGEFGFPPGDIEALETVGDVLLAASGQAFRARITELKPIGSRWFVAPPARGPAGAGEGRTIPDLFLAQARRTPGRVILADQTSGLRTYRDVVTAVLVLSPRIAELPGDRVGILLPAGVGADVVYLAVLFAGKTPVLINWTVGPRNLAHCVGLVDADRILTAGALVSRLEATGTDLSPVAKRFVLLERLAGGISAVAKLWAWVRARTTWGSLDRAAAAVGESDVAAILFTSGSESLPKAVPLTHGNIVANVRDIAALKVVRGGDRLLGILPPFHSFGLTVTTVLPLCLGVAVAHHPDPTEAPVLSRLIEAYRTTIMVGTPTFLDAIARAARPEQLASLRLAVVGAEKCPDRTVALLRRMNATMEILEGYGVTECSPIVSVNRPGRVRPGTIGEPMDSVRHVIVDPETHRPVDPHRQGMLLVSGPSVFDGYLGYDGPSPFVEFDGARWYRTGDLVTEDADGVLTFRGRLKRFVKMAGEMISLPAIEVVLAARADEPDGEQGPTLAVEASEEDGPVEIVLFTTGSVSREEANRHVRQAGLSALHNIRRVVRVEEIPVLGTGKTDYRALRRLLAKGP